MLLVTEGEKKNPQRVEMQDQIKNTHTYTHAHTQQHNSSACPKCAILIIACVNFLFSFARDSVCECVCVCFLFFCDHIRVPSEFRWTLSHARSSKNWINYRSQDTVRASVPVCLKKTRAVVTQLTRTITYILEIPIVRGATLQSPAGMYWMVWWFG